jgi:negative regulator of genetic competence, sporulation and motility
MKIERIDDKTVKCFLSNEELEEYEIDYKDFVTRSDKAKEVVQEIIEQAEEEVGYKPPKYAFDLQIMMLPDEGLVLVFSEKEPLENKNGVTGVAGDEACLRGEEGRDRRYAGKTGEGRNGEQCREK